MTSNLIHGRPSQPLEYAKAKGIEQELWIKIQKSHMGFVILVGSNEFHYMVDLR